MVALFGNASSKAFLGGIAAFRLEEFDDTRFKPGFWDCTFLGSELGLAFFEIHGRFKKCTRFFQPWIGCSRIWIFVVAGRF